MNSHCLRRVARGFEMNLDCALGALIVFQEWSLKAADDERQLSPILLIYCLILLIKPWGFLSQLYQGQTRAPRFTKRHLLYYNSLVLTLDVALSLFGNDFPPEEQEFWTIKYSIIDFAVHLWTFTQTGIAILLFRSFPQYRLHPSFLAQSLG